MAIDFNRDKQERNNGRSQSGASKGVKINDKKQNPSKRRPPVSPVDKKTFNTNIEGNIKFNKEIYSKQNFNNFVNSSFEEVTPRESKFNVDQLFQQYNRLFFDIPQRGPNSHETIIQNSSNYIGGFNNDRDEEIARLNETIVNLESQLASQGNEDNSSVREHPFFKNGTLLFAEEGADWPHVFYMDKGFKRPVNSGDPDFWRLITRLTNTQDEENRIIVPSSILRSIPSGDILNASNFGEEFQPDLERFAAQQTVQDFVISLDPEDAALSPSNIFSLYQGDFNEYRVALERDYNEKTNLITSIENRLVELNNAPVRDELLIEEFNSTLVGVIQRRENITFILENFNDVITEAVLVGVLPNVASQVDLGSPGFDVIYDLPRITQKINERIAGIGGINSAVLISIMTAISNSAPVQQIRSNLDNLNGTLLHHALWYEFIDSSSISDGLKSAIRSVLEEIYNEIRSS